MPLWKVPCVFVHIHATHNASLQTLSFGGGQFGAEEGKGRDRQHPNAKCAKGRGRRELGRKRKEEGRKDRGHRDFRYQLRTYSNGRGS